MKLNPKFHVWIKKSNNINVTFYNSLLLILQWTEIEHCNTNAKLTQKLKSLH